MPTLEATIILKQDGVDLADTPITARVFVPDVQTFDQTRASGGGFMAGGGLGSIQVLLFRTIDETVTVRLDNQSDAGIVIGPSGLMLVFGGVIDSGIPTNFKIENASGSATQIQGVLGGAV